MDSPFWVILVSFDLESHQFSLEKYNLFESTLYLLCEIVIGKCNLKNRFIFKYNLFCIDFLRIYI